MAMNARGVSRPMALQEARASGGHEHGPPYSDARHAILREHHRHTLWVPWTVLLLGVWTVLAPFNFGYLNPDAWVDPSGGRGVWLSEGTHTAIRASLITWSDAVTGALLTFFGWRMLTPNRPISWWIACGLGAWGRRSPPRT